MLLHCLGNKKIKKKDIKLKKIDKNETRQNLRVLSRL